MAIARWLRIIRLRLRSLVRGRALDRELQDEIAFHIAERIDAEIARGAPPDEARRRALAAIGSLTARIEETRDTRGWRLLHDLAQDLRFSRRTLGRAPGFTVAAVLTLALGIGATTTVFAIANGVLFQRPPFPDADQLYVVSSAPPDLGFQVFGLLDRHYLNFAKVDRFFESFAAYSGISANLTWAGEPAQLAVVRVTPNFFRTLRVAPSLGRAFDANDRDERSGPVIVSDRVWRTYLGADPHAVGRMLTLDGTARPVIGVMPPTFAFPVATDVWVPFTITLDPHNSAILPVVGRLKAGASPAQVEAEAAAAIPKLPDDWDEDTTKWVTSVVPIGKLLIHDNIGDVQSSLAILAVAVGFVLLIACANVSGLFVARAASRDDEMAVRMALGAGRGRLARQLLTESALVSLIGGAAGVALSAAAVRVLIALAPDEFSNVDAIHLDGRVLLFALGVSVLAAVVFGFTPLFHVNRHGRWLARRASRSVTATQRLRATFVVAEVALAVVLLVGAGLLARTLASLEAVNPGFRVRNLSTLTFDFPFSVYPTTGDLQRLDDDLLAQLASVPGVISAAAASYVPLSGNFYNGDFHLEDGRPLPKDYSVGQPVVSANYFQTMGIPLVRGRFFDARDRAGAPKVAIISDSVARDVWPDADPIGQRLSWSDHPTSSDWITIVGVVGSVHEHELTSGIDGTIYQPYAQVDRPALQHTVFVLETANGTPTDAAIRAAVHRVDKNLPVPGMLSMQQLVDFKIVDSRFSTWFVSLFATIGLSLAVVGLYGVLAYAVTQRTREIGIRMALGARGADVVGLVLRQTAWLVGAGVVLGLAAALGVTRLLQTLLFGVKPTDPLTFATVILILAAAALLAAAIPTRRAVRVDPTITLRAE